MSNQLITPPPPAINETLLTVSINGRPITIIVVSDNQPEMELAFKLWYEVYIEDLKFKLTEGVSKIEKTLSTPPNGSVVFLALSESKCIGTLRATYDRYSKLECDYTSLLPQKKIGELSKLITSKTYRKTELTAQMLIACFDYNLNSGNYKLYDTVVISCTDYLLPYYFLFGFKKISGGRIIHPHTGNQSNLMQCSYESNERIVGELKMLLKGNKMIKMKFGIKYWLYKNGFKNK